MSKIFKFPDGFLWGTATSAHQVEGNNNNDWTEWEIESVKIKVQNAKLKNWPEYILQNYPNPLQKENYISGQACDHYNRYEEDFDLVKEMGHNAHRFSIEWSRIEPEEGKFNEKEIEHYRNVIRALRARGIEPFVTLWHWTMPIWFVEKGAFEKQENIKYFIAFCEYIASEFKDEITFWITLNEPLVYTKISYIEGRWPPQKKNLLSFFRVSQNLIKAHKTAYYVIKNIHPKSHVGIAHNMGFFELKNDNFINQVLKRFGEWRKNFSFLNAIQHHQDFIGFNYYSHYSVDFGFAKISTQKKSDMGWSLYPPGIYLMLCALKKYNVPIFITENGLADTRDENRSWFIIEHLKWIAKAIAEGINVCGYLHWSLLDNFEWSDGFWPRFGLVEIDYKNLERKRRPSSYVYEKIAKSNTIEIDEP